MTAKACELLLVEDSESDVVIARHAVREAGVSCNLHRVRDGVEALEYLHKQEPFAEAITPDLILLDLNMPRMNGWEVLDHIRSDRRLRRIPVVVLTTSQQEADVGRAYDHLANSFVSKPLDYDDFVRVLESLFQYWIQVVRLPPHEKPGQAPAA